MRYFLFAAASLLVVSKAAVSQTVNDIPLKDVDMEYVEIVGTSRLLSNKVTVEIDFGQRNKALVAKDARIKDASGKQMVFNAMIKAINSMGENGNEFIDSSAVPENEQMVTNIK